MADDKDNRDEEEKTSAFFQGAAHPKRYMGISAAWRRAGREEEAIALLEEAVQNFPEDHILWYRLGKSLYFLNRNEEAIEALETSLDLEPRDHETRRSLEMARRATERENSNPHQNQPPQRKR